MNCLKFVARLANRRSATASSVRVCNGPGILTDANPNQQRTAEDGVNLSAVCDWRFARRIMHRLFSGIEKR
jgi:hypothetical protein